MPILEQIKLVLPKMNIQEKKDLAKQIIKENDYEFAFDYNFIGELIDSANEEILNKMFTKFDDIGILYKYNVETNQGKINVIKNKNLEQQLGKMMLSSKPKCIITRNDNSEFVIGEKGDITLREIEVSGQLGEDKDSDFL